MAGMNMKKFKLIHHVDQSTITAMYAEYAPVFILSTGRSGSKFIVELLNLLPGVNALHEPRPTLQYFSNFAFLHQDQVETLTRMIDATRMEMILETYIQGKIFIESNQCLTFFAPAIAALFGNAKFVHLVRHPGDFVRSAVRKGWHRNDSIWESGRARMADEKCWQAMDQYQKLAWLWTISNGYLEDFKKNLGQRRVMTVRLEDLGQGREHVESVFAFIGSREIEWAQVEKIQETRINALEIYPDEPPNMRKVPDYPSYGDWPEAQKRRFRERVGSLATLYNYAI